MSGLGEWLEGRRPSAPADLRQGIAEALTQGAETLGDRHAVTEPARQPESSADLRVTRLLDGARARLDAARARPGRQRDSAFELLVADALVTYACEAALDTERAERALRRVLEVGRTP